MLGRVQLPPPQVEVRPPRFDLQSLFTWCLRGFTLKCLFLLVLPIPTSFSQAITPAQLPHFTASSKPSFDVELPSPTLSKRGITPLPPQHLPIGSLFLSSILDSWRKLDSRKCRDNPYYMGGVTVMSFALWQEILLWGCIVRKVLFFMLFLFASLFGAEVLSRVEALAQTPPYRGLRLPTRSQSL